MSQTQTFLAFDHGTRNIGVAYGQSLTDSCRELPGIRARDGQPNWQDIESLLKEWQPTLCLIGLPLNMDGSFSEQAARAKKFANRLHGRFGIAVELVDERLSTFEAKQEARERGHKGNYGDDPVDAIAARLIGESWLNARR